MKKINWKILIITSIVCLLPIILGILVYDSLPEEIAIHWNIENEPNNYTSKAIAVFGLPIILTLLQIFCCVVSDINEIKKENKPKFVEIIKWVIPIIDIMTYFSTIGIALGYDIDIRKCVCVFLGLIFMVLGNYFPKMSYEDAKGKIHPMPDNEKSFKKMSRMMGYSIVIFGFALLISIFFKPIISCLVIVLIIVVSVIESILCIKK